MPATSGTTTQGASRSAVQQKRPGPKPVDVRVASASRRAKKRTVTARRKTAKPTASTRLRTRALAVELQHADVAPAHRVPERPVAHPVDLVREQPITREAEHRQADRVGGVAIARHRLHGHDEARPEEKRRQQQEPPDQQERPDLEGDAALDQDGDQPRQARGHDDHQADHGLRRGLAQQQRAGADRGGMT